MISASMSAAAATRKLGFWTNFGIMARDAPPRPIMPTPKTRSLAAICSLLSRNDCLTLYVFDDYPSSKKLSRSARVPRAGDGYTLVAGRLADLYSTLVQCIQNVQVVQIDSGFFPTVNALNGARRLNGLNQEFVNSEEATRLVHTTRKEKMSSEVFRFFG